MRPTLTVIVPAHNAEADLRYCLEAIAGSADRPEEVIVADDGSTDSTAAAARTAGVTLVSIPAGPLGPARARNLAARQASGDLLVFLDADVTVHQDTIGRARSILAEDPSLAAAIGAYDDDPACPDFLSQYKNLQHCFVHRDGGRREAATFWTGCGVIRRAVFESAGGFPESYTRPSIEDIELGVRLTRAGHRIVLDPAMQVKHRKQWTAAGLIRTDIRQRAVPWSRLILREGRMPNDLNLGWAHRISAAAVCLGLLATLAAGPSALASLALAAWCALGYYWIEGLRQGNVARSLVALAWLGAAWTSRGSIPVSAAAALAVPVVLNRAFYIFLARRRGWLFALAAIPWQLLYLAYSSASLAAVALLQLTRPLRIA